MKTDSETLVQQEENCSKSEFKICKHYGQTLISTPFHAKIALHFVHFVLHSADKNKVQFWNQLEPSSKPKHTKP